MWWTRPLVLTLALEDPCGHRGDCLTRVPAPPNVHRGGGDAGREEAGEGADLLLPLGDPQPGSGGGAYQNSGSEGLLIPALGWSEGACSSVPKPYPTLPPHGLQHTRLPCPSLCPGICSDSCPLSRLCHPSISSSASPFPSAFNLSQHQGLFH